MTAVLDAPSVVVDLLIVVTRQMKPTARGSVSVTKLAGHGFDCRACGHSEHDADKRGLGKEAGKESRARWLTRAAAHAVECPERHGTEGWAIGVDRTVEA